MNQIETDIIDIRTKIKQLNEEQCDFETNIKRAERDEEENIQVLHRQYLDLDYMAEVCKGDRKLQQLISQKHEMLLNIKRTQSRLLDELHYEGKETGRRTKSKIEELKNQICELERKIGKNDE